MFVDSVNNRCAVSLVTTTIARPIVEEDSIRSSRRLYLRDGRAIGFSLASSGKNSGAGVVVPFVPRGSYGQCRQPEPQHWPLRK